ncbi:hypothetical protein WBS55_01470 [Bacillus luti]
MNVGRRIVAVAVDVTVIRVNAVMNVGRRIVAVAVDVTVIHANAVMNVERQIAAVVEGVIHIHVNVVIAAVNRNDIVDAIDKGKHHLVMVFYLYSCT